MCNVCCFGDNRNLYSANSSPLGTEMELGAGEVLYTILKMQLLSIDLRNKNETRVAYLPDCCELLLHEPPLLYIIPAPPFTNAQSFKKNPWICRMPTWTGAIPARSRSLGDGIHDRVSKVKKRDICKFWDRVPPLLGITQSCSSAKCIESCILRLSFSTDT